jgi:hypothetical protein
MKIIERSCAVAQDDFAKQSEGHALAIENRDAKIGLKLFEAAGEIGLGHAQRLRRTTEMAMLRQRGDDFELTYSGHADALYVSNNIRVDIGPAKSMHGNLRLHPSFGSFGRARRI